MATSFHENGLSFSYPENWTLEREESESGWTISLYSPVTAFLTVNLDTNFPDCEQVSLAALEAMQEEYPQLEASESAIPIAGSWAVGHEMSFFSFDLTNTCWTHCFEIPAGTILILCQVSDLDPAEKMVLRAICSSLRVDREAEG